MEQSWYFQTFSYGHLFLSFLVLDESIKGIILRTILKFQIEHIVCLKIQRHWWLKSSFLLKLSYLFLLTSWRLYLGPYGFSANIFAHGFFIAKHKFSEPHLV